MRSEARTAAPRAAPSAWYSLAMAEAVDPPEALRQILMERRRATEERYREARERQHSGDAAGDSEGVHGWKASREGGPDMALLEMLDATLRQIDAALVRLERGLYGRCSACGEPIPLTRLRALPFATHCIPCQSRREDGTTGRGR